MERSQQTTVLVVTTVTGFLATFIASSVNIALPLIQSEFHVSAPTLGWVSLSYVLAMGALLMPMGRVADIRGRKAIYLVGSAGFALFTLACAVSPSVEILLVLRLIQGAAGGMLFSTFTVLVILAFPPETRGRGLGIQIAGVYLGLTLGPVLGGVISHNAGWRALFIIVGALALVNTVIPFWTLRSVEWKEPRSAPFDYLGSFAWAVALSVLLLGFSLLPKVVGAVLVGLGVLGLAVFFWWENRAKDPILNVELLRRNRVFAYSNLAAFINYAATFAMTFLMSLYLQYNRGLDAQSAGFILVTGAFLQTAFSPVAGRLSDKFNARIIASAGMSLSVLGLFAFAFLSETTPWWYVVAVLCVLGVGIAFFATPMTHTIMGSIENRHVGVAGAILATMRVTGQSFSQGIATLVLAVVVGRHAIQSADYPHLLTSVRITFAIFAALCLVGVAASLVRPRLAAGRSIPKLWRN
ncbi:MAG TPA: MFS transporter [Thermoleophilia bacterium]|nr:MFS transporter [Thermoleophilia bacterium]